jgi:hypothetical protein
MDEERAAQETHQEKAGLLARDDMDICPQWLTGAKK